MSDDYVTREECRTIKADFIPRREYESYKSYVNDWQRITDNRYSQIGEILDNLVTQSAMLVERTENFNSRTYRLESRMECMVEKTEKINLKIAVVGAILYAGGFLTGQGVFLI